MRLNVCECVCLCLYHLTAFLLQVDRFKALTQPGNQNENTILAQIRRGLSPAQVPQKSPASSKRARAAAQPTASSCKSRRSPTDGKLLQRKGLGGADRWWKIKYAGEEGSDAGGLFRDSLSAISTELQRAADFGESFPSS